MTIPADCTINYKYHILLCIHLGICYVKVNPIKQHIRCYLVNYTKRVPISIALIYINNIQLSTDRNIARDL